MNVELPGPNSEIKTKCELRGGFFVFDFIGKTADFTSELNEDEKNFVSKNLKKSSSFHFWFRISSDIINLITNDKQRY